MAMLSGTPVGLAGRADLALDRLNEVMDLILEALDTNVEQICVTDDSSQPGLQKDFPVKGAQRWIIDRTPDGRNLPLENGVITPVLPANVNRLGGTLVNNGEKAITLYLAKPSQINAGTATIILSANGGSWDFRLGNLFWCGSVTAKAVGGASEVSIAEV